MDDLRQDGTTPSPRPPNAHPSLSKARSLESSADIPVSRHTLEDWLHNNAPQLDDMRRYEIVLAANELLVNAFEHGDDGGCMFDMRRASDHLTLTVTNNAENSGVLSSESWTMPEAGDRSGRGLAIVKSVADEVAECVTPTTVSIAATFDLQSKTRTRGLLEAKLAL